MHVSGRGAQGSKTTRRRRLAGARRNAHVTAQRIVAISMQERDHWLLDCLVQVVEYSAQQNTNLDIGTCQLRHPTVGARSQTSGRDVQSLLLNHSALRVWRTAQSEPVWKAQQYQRRVEPKRCSQSYSAWMSCCTQDSSRTLHSKLQSMQRKQCAQQHPR